MTDDRWRRVRALPRRPWSSLPQSVRHTSPPPRATTRPCDAGSSRCSSRTPPTIHRSPGCRAPPACFVRPTLDVELLGAGGMGEVYRARDTTLDRDVALKVLPEAFASDHERLARFEREARTLAALNHPHIAHIHGLHESDDVRALVLEFVDGATL